jgi:hypothetical protein
LLQHIIEHEKNAYECQEVSFEDVLTEIKKIINRPSTDSP